MKTNFKKIFLIFLAIITFSCDNDADPSPNDNQCNYEGFTFLDTSNNIQTLIAEADLTTDFFPNNGGPGIPGIEIYETANPGNMNFITDVVTLNASGSGTLQLNGTNYAINVICQRAGTAVGDEFRFDLTSNGVEAEFCVTIDNVTP